MTSTYTATLEIKRLRKDGRIDDQAPKVCFKRDGQRFECENTLKLLVDTFYEFTVNIRPPTPLHSVSVQGSAVTIVDVSEGGQGSTYSFKWDTMKMEPDRRKKRTICQLMLQFQGGLTLVLPLQVKFYKLEDEDHLSWGNALHHIDFECELKTGNLEILKTLFH